MNFKNVILIIALLSLCLGCVKIKSKDKKESSGMRPQSHEVPAATGQPEFEWIESDLPNQYQIKIQRSSGANVVIQTELDANGSAGSEFLFFQDDFVLGNNLKSGLRYRFQLGKMTDTGFLMISEFTAQTPVDLVVEGEWVLSDSVDKQIGRIYLAKNAKIKVLDKNLNLRAKSLFSEGAVLYAFSERDSVFPEVAGKNAGNVHITVERAKGELKFDLRGQKGGSGKTGENWLPIQAVKGSDSEGDQYIQSVDHVWNCSSLGKPPTNGADGNKGKIGGKGGRSGDNGSLSLEVEKDEGFLYSIIETPRVGGAGGKGGPGQLGGSPGKVHSQLIAAHPFVQLCKHPKVFQGTEGSIGDDGESGMPGAKGLTCVAIDEQPRKCL